MDFGKVKPEEMARIDFALPPDHAFTSRTLPGPPAGAPQVFVGCPIWASKDWAGKVYPPGAREKEYLKHYARQFNTIELNTTHYRIPDPDTIEKWKLATAPGFRFCPKIPQVISHDRALVDAEALTQAFCLSVAGLGERLGVAFLQLPPSFGPANGPILANYLRQFPASIPLAVEFRHPDWFNQPAVWHQTLAMLRDHGVSTVITDVAGRRDALH
ncbi:MAG: DUF72 domain-containing protein, partial [Ferruginibacter sp.]|nr:DUF72 domain-containing protein [Cytophagales bacterium]